MNKCSVLVVDDNEVFRGGLRSCLEAQGYEVAVADCGEQAKKILMERLYDLVLSDIRMEPVNGIELLRHIKGLKNGPPVVLMTGFSEILETRQAAALGADGFLPKPFKPEELLEVLEAARRPQAAPTSLDDDFSKLSMDDFVSGQQIRYDIHIRLSSVKYVKIAHRGEQLSLSQIQSYKGKGVRFLYMTKADFRKYVGFNVALSKLVGKSGQIPRQRKLGFLKHTVEVILQQMHEGLVAPEDFLNARTVVETMISVMLDEDSTFSMLDVLNAHADYVYAHSVAVSLYSVLIARSLGWTSPQNIGKLAMAGLLHDIGKKEIDRALLYKPRESLTFEEEKLLESHPARGVEILSQVRSVPSDVLQAVLQHHENCVGTGYPSGLRQKKIHPFARIVAVADEFCNLVIKRPHCEPVTPSQAASRLLTGHGQTLDATFVEALVRALKLPARQEIPLAPLEPAPPAQKSAI